MALRCVEPDIVVVDTALLGGTRLHPHEIRSARPGTRVVVFSAHAPQTAKERLPGADAYVIKSGIASELIATLRAQQPLLASAGVLTA